MKINKWFLLSPIILAAVAGLFVLVLLVLKFCWGWIVPDLFPGAVAQGLIANDLSWLTSLKLALVLTILGSFVGSRNSTEKKCRCHSK